MPSTEAIIELVNSLAHHQPRSSIGLVINIQNSSYNGFCQLNDIQRYSKEACGNFFALSPKYFLYKSSAGCPSISRIFASDFVIIRSGPKGIHPPKLAKDTKVSP
jgi:hypothetical protein